MNNMLFSPFSKATCEVFKLMLDIDASVSKLESINGPVEDKDCVHVSVGLTGDLLGEIIYCFPNDTTLKIVNIMSGMEIDQIDEFVTSALSEISNIISGNAMTILSEENFACDILPPRIITDMDDASSGEIDKETVIRVNTSVGEMELDIRLKA